MTIQDSTRSIASSAKHFFSGTAISRATGLAREVAMALVFGTHPMVAAFWMAFRFANLLRRLFGEGALHAVFVPHYESLRKQDSALGARFFYDLSAALMLLLLAITLLAEGLLGGILLFASLQESSLQVIKLTMVMLPALVFICLYALNTSLLNCERSYFLPSLAPALLNVVWVGAIFVVWQLPIEKGVEYLAMIVVFAFALQWGVTAPHVFRYLTRELGDKWHEKGFSGREILKIARPFMLGMIGVCATQVNTAFDAVFAWVADSQGPAYLWYAIRIQQLPLALIGVGLTGALLPPITRAIQKGEREQYLHFLNFAMTRALLFMVPMTGGIFALGFCGINLVYGHGAFSQEATYQTTLCLWAYGLALLPMTFVLICASACYAHKNYRMPTLFSLFTVVLNVTLNALFVYALQWGAISIALATTLSTLVNGILLAYLLKKQYGLSLAGIAISFLKIVFATLLAVAATVTLGFYLFQDNTLAWLMGQPLAPFARDISTQLFCFGMQALTFTVAFLLTAFALRIDAFSLAALRKLKTQKI